MSQQRERHDSSDPFFPWERRSLQSLANRVRVQAAVDEIMSQQYGVPVVPSTPGLLTTDLLAQQIQATVQEAEANFSPFEKAIYELQGLGETLSGLYEKQDERQLLLLARDGIQIGESEKVFMRYRPLERGVHLLFQKTIGDQTVTTSIPPLQHHEGRFALTLIVNADYDTPATSDNSITFSNGEYNAKVCDYLASITNRSIRAIAGAHNT